MDTDDQVEHDPEKPETPAERIDRNWNELLQEVRVSQTGVQILTGFLLTLPFQSTFDDLDPGDKRLYLWVLSLALTATVLLLTPVVLHRALFRAHAKDVILKASTRLAVLGLAVLAAALAGVAWLVWGVVAGDHRSMWAAGGIAALVVALWGLLPMIARRRISDEPYS